MTTHVNDASFGVDELRRTQLQLGRLMKAARTMEACGRVVCSTLYEELRSSQSAEDGCALVRCFKTHRFGDLDPTLRQAARTGMGEGHAARPDLSCLVLLASHGDELAWQSRHTAIRHRIIPLPSQSALDKVPMVLEVFRQFNVTLDDIRHPAWTVGPETVHAYNVCHIEETLGNRHIPDQDGFIKPYGIRSMVAFGGPVRRGDLYAVLLFCKRPVPIDVARQFRHIALDVTASFFRFDDRAVFDNAREVA